MITPYAIVFIACVVIGVVLFGLHPTLLERTTRRRADSALLAGLVLMFGSFMMFVISLAVTHA